MKTNQKVAVTIIVLVGFVVGMLIGVSLTNPGMSVFEAAGSIGKVDKYRNVKITEEDIELRNILLTDESLREAYKDYLIFEYTAQAKMAEDIQYSLDAAREISSFNAISAESMMKLEDFTTLLQNSRGQLLEAIAVLSGLPDMNRIAIQSVLMDASNAMAHISSRNNVLFDFINDVELFLDEGIRGEFSRLERAHDLLFANLLSSSIINDNRIAVRHLLYDKELLSRNENLAMDQEALSARLALDFERPSRIMMDIDQEQFGIMEAEQLGVFWAVRSARNEYMTFDAESLESMFSMKEIRAFDSEQLNDFFRNEHYRTFDFSTVETEMNAEMLRDIMVAREQVESFATLSRNIR
jgi:hypothetical protein